MTPLEALMDALASITPTRAARRPRETAISFLNDLEAAGYVLARKPVLEGVAWVPIEGDELARLHEIERASRELLADFNHVIGCPAMEGVTAPFGGAIHLRTALGDRS